MARYYHYDGLAPENLDEVPCAVCEVHAGTTVAIDNGFQIQRCRECGFVYVNPRPNEQQLTEFYEKFYDPGDVVPDKWEREMGGIFRECARWLEQSPSKGRVLDIGCSFGHFLADMEQRGWESVGIEPSPVAVDFARSLLRGEVHENTFEGVSLEAGSFDAVVSLYVLEHVRDPRGFMKEVRRLLRPGGQAIIRIPYTAPLFPLQKALRRPLMYAPMHLNDFSPETMMRMCWSLGFSRVDVQVGARRHAHDWVENVGARVFGGMGRALEVMSGGRRVFPWVGALSYRVFA